MLHYIINAALHCQRCTVSSMLHNITYFRLHHQRCIISTTLYHIINAALNYQGYITSSTSSLMTHDIFNDAFCNQCFINMLALHCIISAKLNHQLCTAINNVLHQQRCITSSILHRISTLHHIVNAVLHCQHSFTSVTLRYAALKNGVDPSKNSITQCKVTYSKFF